MEYLDGAASSCTPRVGDLCDLVQRHIGDPVDPDEQLRNEQVYAWQANRNSFIDHPEWVLAIWGPACSIEPSPADAGVAQVPVPAIFLGLLGLGLGLTASGPLRARARRLRDRGA